MPDRDFEQFGDPEILQIMQIQIMPSIDTQSAGGSCSRRLLKLREYRFMLASLVGSGLAFGVELDPVGAQRRDALNQRGIRVHKETDAASR